MIHRIVISRLDNSQSPGELMCRRILYLFIANSSAAAAAASEATVLSRHFLVWISRMDRGECGEAAMTAVRVPHRDVMALLASLLALVLSFHFEEAAAQPSPPTRVVYATQGWTDADRAAFYTTGQGSHM